MQRLQLHALVAELQATLEADGQLFGTGAHLRIGELLQNLPENTAPEQLKTMLAPVLCSTKEEQERFYQLFERSWKQVEATGVLEVEIDDLPFYSLEKTRITPWAALTAALVLLALWGIGNWAGADCRKEIPIAFHHISATVGDTAQSIQIDSLVGQSLTEGRQSFSVEPLSKYAVKKERGNAGLKLDSQANRIFYSGLKEGSDTVWLRAHPHGWHHTQVWRHQIVFSVYPPPDTSKEEDAPLDTALYVQRPIPHPRDLTQLELPQPTALQQFLLDWEWPIKFLGMLLAGLLVWFAARLWERNQRKLIAEHRPNQKPPYAWSIQLENPPKVNLGERFHRLLSQLRRREADENWRLDVPRTLRATIAKGGVPQFRYAQQTRPSEYLLLIDRHSPRNHQAQLYDLMFQAFRNQEVLLERFWYDGDPRLCWNETFPAGLDLRAMHYHYPQSRVIIFGDGEQLLNQNSGRLTKWASQTFSAWQDRAVLTPKPLKAWGRREYSLQEQFHVLPVSLSALEVAIERFETDIEKNTALDPRRFSDAANDQIQLIDNDLIKTLQHYFGDTNNPLPIWVAACAVYPELHWDMTLYLGELLSDSDTQLLSSDNIAQICRLPWFTEGEIPLEARKTLLAWLEREQPDTLHTIREGIHRLLAQNPPPEDSAAHDAYAMNMALNEWLYTKDSARKKELEKDILRRIAAGQAADFMVLKILEGPRSPEEFEVPENWRKYLKQKGMAKTTRKSWVWAVPLWVVLCIGLVGWKPEAVGCKGVAMATQGKEWCAETLEEVLQVWEMQALNWISQQDSISLLQLADLATKDILKSGRANAWKNQAAKNWQQGIGNLGLLGPIDSISFFQNLAVGYFNEGVKLHEALENDTLSCYFFLQAQRFNALLPDTAQLWYAREAASMCNNLPSYPKTEREKSIEKIKPEVGTYSTVNVTIGDGLEGRKVLYRSSIEEYPSPKKGKIVVFVCVDSLGNVIKSEFIAKGSTSTDSLLRVIAIRAAQSFQFEPTLQKQQCGTITFDFVYKVLVHAESLKNEQPAVSEDPGATLFEKGNKHFDKTQYTDARLCYEDIIKKLQGKTKYHNLALLQLGRIEYYRGSTETSINYYKQVFANNPSNNEAKLALEALWEIYSGLERLEGYFAFLETIPIWARLIDRDGDGVPDTEDKCADEKGDKENGGCPPPPLFNIKYPIVVYFDTNKPTLKQAKSDYQKLFVEFIRRKDEFKNKFSEGLNGPEKEGALNFVEDFFEKDVRSGWDTCFSFVDQLFTILNEGGKIELTIKGYTSPLGSQKENLSLSSRRIDSVIELFRVFDGGVFSPYLSTGALVIKREPYGESYSIKGIIDNPDDPRNSIYSPIAARENRVEIFVVKY